MNTKTKKTAKINQNNELKRHESISQHDIIKSIKNEFNNFIGKIDVKHLWSDDTVHRFRVNCWSDSEIKYSEFIRAIEQNGTLTIKRDSHDKQ